MQHRLHIQPVWTYARKPTRGRARSRALYALLAIAVIAAGLLWRSGLIPLPQWLSNNGGDALWALMVFVGFGFLLPRASTLLIALLALAVAWGVEFSSSITRRGSMRCAPPCPVDWCLAPPSTGLT